MHEITINLQTPEGLTLEGTTIPDDYTVNQIVQEIVDELQLPLLSFNEEIIVYSLEWGKQGSILQGEKTLREQGVADGDTLCLIASHEAKNPSLDIFDDRNATLQANILEVQINVLDVNTIVPVNLNRNETAGNLISNIIELYNLPTHNPKLKQPYKIRSRYLGRLLHSSETMLQAEIPSSDTLTVYREEIAGGGEFSSVSEKRKSEAKNLHFKMPIVPSRSTLQEVKKILVAMTRGIVVRLRNLTRPLDTYYDPVDCTVFAPPIIPQGANVLIQVFAHRPEHVTFVNDLAREFDEDAQRRGFKSFGMKVARGSKLTFHLTLPNIEIEDAVQSIEWQGLIESIQFALVIPESQRLGGMIGTVTISYNQAPLGHIKFKLTITEAFHTLSESQPLGIAYTYQKAFISYASPDRLEVLKRVQMLKILRIKTFQDVLNLEPGMRWEKELYRHIDESDLFLLFWSSAAKQSQWVMQEVQYALRRKGNDDCAPPEIIPVILEGPPSVPPPKELEHLHFNDYLIYLISNYQA